MAPMAPKRSRRSCSLCYDAVHGVRVPERTTLQCIWSVKGCMEPLGMDGSGAGGADGAGAAAIHILSFARGRALVQCAA